MQTIGKRLKRGQLRVLKQLRGNEGFGEMNTKAFLSLCEYFTKAGLRLGTAASTNLFGYLHPVTDRVPNVVPSMTAWRVITGLS